MNIKGSLIIILSCVLLEVHAQTSLSIIPAPVKTQIGNGSFTITRQTVIIAGNDKEQATIHFFNAYLKQYYGFSLAFNRRPGLAHSHQKISPFNGSGRVQERHHHGSFSRHRK